MRITPILSAALLSFFAVSAHAFQARPMPTLTALQNQAAKNPAGARTVETVKNTAGEGFTGEVLLPDGDLVPRTDDGRGRTSDSYHFKGSSPFKGVTIYTPEPDAPGNEDTNEPAPEKTLLDWIHKPLLGIGAALALGGLFFAPLLFLGGLLLGAGAVLWYINSKIKK